MDGKVNERWCMLGFGGGGQDKTVTIDRIMLGFRPIAPKPAIGGSVSGILLVDNKNLLRSRSRSSRSKRKYVKVRRNNNGFRGKNKKTDGYRSKDRVDNHIVTLQLLPERVDIEDSTRRSESWCINLESRTEKEKMVSDNNFQEQRTRLMLKNQDFSNMGEFIASDQIVVKSWLTVEAVTGACMDERGLGSKDVEIMKNLDKDMCPGFMTDGFNKVKWVNEAYKKMVPAIEENAIVPSSEKVMMVSLFMKEKFPCLFSSLTCRVRVQYTCGNDKYSKMFPCDVWRMECGAFAWRLDVDSAFGLGR